MYHRVPSELVSSWSSEAAAYGYWSSWRIALMLALRPVDLCLAAAAAFEQPERQDEGYSTVARTRSEAKCSLVCDSTGIWCLRCWAGIQVRFVLFYLTAGCRRLLSAAALR